MCISLFFFKQNTSYEMRISDWSSDVCSSDLFEFMAHLLAEHQKDALADQLQVALIEPDIAHAGLEKNAHPLVIYDHRIVFDVKSLQPCGDRLASIFDPVLPLRLPAIQVDIVIDPVDLILFCREIAIEQWLRPAEPLCQFARLPIEPHFGEKANGRRNDQIGRAHV